MTAQTVYTLDYQANLSGNTHSASLALDFSNTDGYFIYLRGSYNHVDVKAKSLYIDNSQNAAEIFVTSTNGEINRIVPPRGQIWISVANYPSILIAGDAGQCEIEITDKIVGDFLFQRSDGFGSSFPADSVSPGAAIGDLVTVDFMGRVQTVNKPVLVDNNVSAIVDNLPVSTNTFQPLAVSFRTNSADKLYTRDGDTVVVALVNPALQVQILRADATIVGPSQSIVPGQTVALSLATAPDSYLVKVNAGAVWEVDKTTGAVSDFIPQTEFSSRGYLRDGIIAMSSENDKSCVVLTGSTGTGTNVKVFHFDENGNFIGDSAADILASYSGIGVLPTNRVKTIRRGKKLPNGKYCFYSHQFSTTTAGNTRLVWYNGDLTAPFVAGTGSTPAVLAAVLTFNSNDIFIIGQYVVCVIGGGVQAFDFDGNLVTTLVLVNLPVSIVQNDQYIIVGVRSNTYGQMFRIDADLNVTSFDVSIAGSGYQVDLFAIGDFAFMVTRNTTSNINQISALDAVRGVAFPNINGATNLPTINNLSYLYSIVLGDTYFYWNNLGSAPFAVGVYFNKTVFGVLTAPDSVGVKGEYTINQNFPGSQTFNYNGNNPLGNRGLVFNNFIELSGLV